MGDIDTDHNTKGRQDVLHLTSRLFFTSEFPYSRRKKGSFWFVDHGKQEIGGYKVELLGTDNLKHLPVE